MTEGTSTSHTKNGRRPKRFFAYCKVDDPSLIERQRALCRAFVVEQGGSIVDEASDVGHGSVVDMPGYARFDVQAGFICADRTRSRVGNPVVSQPKTLGFPGFTQASTRPSIGACSRRPLPPASRRDPTEGRPTRNSRAAPDVLPAGLPDALRFHPAQPSGFTFAAMNGRRPEDDVDPMVRTILAAVPKQVGEIFSIGPAIDSLMSDGLMTMQLMFFGPREMSDGCSTCGIGRVVEPCAMAT